MRGWVLSFVMAFGLLLGSPFVTSPAQAAEKLNVLMIAVDDLRPQIGCYGDKLARTPNLDRLASRGVVFNRAYCQQAVCSPSRTSLMTGCRPDTTKVWDLKTHFRKNIPDVVTLGQCFKNNGYHTQSLSKIFHSGFDDPPSWSVPAWFPKNKNYGDPGLLRKLDEAKRVKGPAWESPDVADNALRDGETADKAVEVLREVKDKPFFLAVGFYKPHLPFVAPKKYFEMFPLESIRLPDNPNPPKDVPELALTDWGELRGYMDVPQSGPLSDEMTRKLIQAYYAAAAYADAQIGKVLAELERLGLA
ncbi:MAG: sulfatase, partial [Phycisphaerae bacterium]|nr:sulfatase [Phycisphaerae bacterium]